MPMTFRTAFPRLLCLALAGLALTACSGKDYHLSVRVSGMSGTGLVLLNNGTDALGISGNGTHEFRTGYPFAYPYKVSVQTQPTGPEQLCTVLNSQGRLTRDVSDIQVNCIDAYRVSGSVTALQGTGLVLINNQTERLTITANGAFTFSRLQEDGSQYNVEVLQQPTNQLCRVDNPTGVINGSNVNSVVVVCGTRTVGGTLTGLLGGQLELQNNGTDNLIMQQNGSFTFATTFYDGATYAVTVSVPPSSQVCEVSNGSGTVAGANVTSVGVSCGYSVGGTIAGPSGALVVLQLNGANDLTLGMNRSFAFSKGLTTGTPYSVTLLTVPDGLSCQVVNGSGTIATSPVGDVVVNCREGPTLTVDYGVKQVVLNWDTVSGIDVYRVFRSTNAGQTFTQLGGDLAPGALSYTDPVDVHLADWLNLSYKVQSCAGAVCDDSNTVSFLNSARATGYVKASNTGAQDRFGSALAVSADGTTLAVGAPLEDSAATVIDGNEVNDCTAPAPANCAGDSGAVFVYIDDNGVWSRQAYVKPANTGIGDRFGSALDLSADGSTLVVGAPFEDSDGSSAANDSAPDSGAVYVFTRSGAAWTQQSYVKASNAGTGDQFGAALELAGDGSLLAAGAPFEDSDATGVYQTLPLGAENNDLAADSGAAYLFVQGAGVWSQQAYVKASNTGAGDDFGQALALSGDGGTLFAGAPLEDSNASGIYPTLPHGAENNDLADGAGAAYAYVQSAGVWSQQAYVKATNTEAGLNFGRTVALAGNGDTLAVGAPLEDSAAFPTSASEIDDCETPAPVNCAADSGAVFVYARSAGTLSRQAYLKAGNLDAGDLFGSALEFSLGGNVLAVGAPGEASRSSGIGGEETDNFAPGSGAVYLMGRSGAVWGEGPYVKSANTGEGDGFGSDIGLASDATTLVVGAPFEDSAATLINGDRTDDCTAASPANCAADSGAAYIF